MKHFLRGLSLFITITLLSACNRPVADFLYESEDAVAPAVISFADQSKNALSYNWDFGDGNTSDQVNPNHRYLTSGNYEVTLVIQNGKKEAKQSKRIMIKSPEACLVEIQTNYGNMLVKLYDETPKHRDNFVKLAEEGYYDELLFHRVISGFMIQGGDPESKDAAPGKMLGAGGPGYKIDAEILPEFIHKKGALSAARQGDQVNPQKKSSGSQFYIVQGKPLKEAELERNERMKRMAYSEEQKQEYMEKGGTPFLDKEYTVFGEVIEGMDVIDKIAAVQTDGRDRPTEDVKIKMVVIK